MEQVKKLGNGSTRSPKGPKIKPPNGFYTLTDVSKHVRKLVDEQWHRIEATQQFDLFYKEVNFKEALIHHLLEYLIWQFDLKTKNLGNRKICLWQDGKLIYFDASEDMLPSHRNELPRLGEILFKSDLALKEFSVGGDISFVIGGDEDNTDFVDYVSTLKTGYEFVDVQTWSVLSEPKPESRLPSHLIISEREHRQDYWERVKPFSGAVFVCAGRSASKIADRTKTELKKFFGKYILPDDDQSLREQVEYTVERYLELSPAELAEFRSKPKQTFADWIIGDNQAATDRKITSMWQSFQKILRQEHGIEVGGRGRRAKK